jgi:Protein of unknown function (DUF3043)
MLVVVTEAEPGEHSGEHSAGKGRPTPKRRDAQKRRGAVPTNKKDAAAARRTRLREERMVQRKALLSGDERHLPARDAGPAKRLARDVVDSRFTLGQIFFGLILVVLAASLVIPRNYKTTLAAVNALSFLTVILVFLDSVRIGRRAKQMVTTAYDEKSAYGVTAYAAIRAMQPRRLRRPPPKIKRGQDLGAG